jgi:hypothetical protein
MNSNFSRNSGSSIRSDHRAACRQFVLHLACLFGYLPVQRACRQTSDTADGETDYVYT